MKALTTTYIIIETGEFDKIMGGMVANTQQEAIEAFVADTPMSPSRFFAYDVEYNIGELTEYEAWELDLEIHERHSFYEGVKKFQASRGLTFNG